MTASSQASVTMICGDSADRNPATTSLSDVPDGSALVNPEIALHYFFDKCSLDRVERALARPRPQSFALFTEPVRIGKSFARLPRGYVETADDAALFLLQQRDMQAALVITLPSDHSPFCSMPDRLAAALIQIAEDFGPALSVMVPRRRHFIVVIGACDAIESTIRTVPGQLE